MEELKKQIESFQKLSLQQQYQKVMGILDYLQEEVPICKQLFGLFQKQKNQVNFSMLNVVYKTIISFGAKIEYDLLLEDGKNAVEVLEQYKEIEESAELQKIKNELDGMK